VTEYDYTVVGGGTGGRGLVLVEALSNRWGWETLCRG